MCLFLLIALTIAISVAQCKPNFPALQAALMELFPRKMARTPAPVVCYLDDQDDEVVLANDEDLQEAVRVCAAANPSQQPTHLRVVLRISKKPGREARVPKPGKESETRAPRQSEAKTLEGSETTKPPAKPSKEEKRLAKEKRQVEQRLGRLERVRARLARVEAQREQLLATLAELTGAASDSDSSSSSSDSEPELPARAVAENAAPVDRKEPAEVAAASVPPKTDLRSEVLAVLAEMMPDIVARVRAELPPPPAALAPPQPYFHHQPAFHPSFNGVPPAWAAARPPTLEPFAYQPSVTYTQCTPEFTARSSEPPTSPHSHSHSPATLSAATQRPQAAPAAVAARMLTTAQREEVTQKVFRLGFYNRAEIGPLIDQHGDNVPAIVAVLKESARLGPHMAPATHPK